MKQTKLYVNYSGNEISVIYYPKEKQYLLYHPNEDRELLHELFGGDPYYTSVTGKTGAGYLSPKPSEILVPIGYYRVDTGPFPGHQQKRIVGTNTRGNEIYAYYPIVNGGGDKKYPVVLTDGKQIVFARPDQSLSQTIPAWDSLAKTIDSDYVKNIKYPYYDRYGDINESKFVLINPYNYTGINAARFFDLRTAQAEFAQIALETDERPDWARELWVIPIDTTVFVGNYMGVCDQVFQIDDFPSRVRKWNIRQNGTDITAWSQHKRDMTVDVMKFDTARPSDPIEKETYTVYEFYDLGIADNVRLPEQITEDAALRPYLRMADNVRLPEQPKHSKETQSRIEKLNNLSTDQISVKAPST